MVRLLRTGLFAVVCVAAATPTLAQGRVIVESPVNSYSYSEPVVVSGYAIDTSYPTGTGIEILSVHVCPGACNGSNYTFVGSPTYGTSRPDVASAFGDARFAPSGFSLTLSGLAPGLYEIHVQGRTTGTTTWTEQSVFVMLVATPLLAIEAPTHNQTVGQPFTITGFGADLSAPSGTGVTQVTAHVYPNPGSGAAHIWLPAATYGASRPDVAAFAGNARFDPAGWQVVVPAGYLPAGQYMLIIFMHLSSGGVVGASRTIYVDAAPAALVVDRAGGGTGGVSSSPAGLYCPGGFGTQALPCETSYLQSSATPVTLTATADVGSTFAGWSGACTGTGTCEVTMNQGRYVTATFAGVSAASFQTTYYHADTVGSVRAITDEGGQPVTQRSYAPFGEDPGALTGDPIRFAGHQLDPETALQYFGARYYRNTAGRFTTVDPGQVGAHLDRPQTWNAYAYAGNNPLRWVDQSGLDFEVCVEGNCVVFMGDWDDFVAGLGEGDVSARYGGLYHSSRPGSFGFYTEIGHSSELERNPPDRSVLQAIFEALTSGGGGGGNYEPPGQGKGGGPGPNGQNPTNPFVPAPDLPKAPQPPQLPAKPRPNGWFGTNWCGPGGTGAILNKLDQACFEHDACWGSTFTAFSAVGVGVNGGNYARLKACNINFCFAAMASGDPGSLRAAAYFSSVPVGSCAIGQR